MPVPSYPIPWDVSHRNDIPMDKPSNKVYSYSAGQDNTNITETLANDCTQKEV